MLESQGAEAVVDTLVMPHLRHHLAFRLYAHRLNLSQRVKAGSYELNKGMSVIDVVRMLSLGEQTPVRITFNNVRVVEQLAGRLSQQIDADSAALVSAMRSDSLAKEYGISTKEIFSLFIPNTYEVWWTITPEDLVRRIYLEHDRFWTAERDALRKGLKLSRVEVITLASIVYEETKKVDEMSRIAGVYLNRLRRGMRLQADPTVKYALGDFTIRRVLYRHLEYDSPYNTYRYKGLPPSPIALPSIAAIESVLRSESHSYLYFCARPEMDGYHNFSKSYAEHQRYAREFAAELNRRGVE